MRSYKFGFSGATAASLDLQINSVGRGTIRQARFHVNGRGKDCAVMFLALTPPGSDGYTNDTAPNTIIAAHACPAGNGDGATPEVMQGVASNSVVPLNVPIDDRSRMYLYALPGADEDDSLLDGVVFVDVV